ncbi:creatininase family protein [Consotaella aegiceratis]|uniref:creatininase family protein n=1 Tax=Consotaella aegiceratis TaxID=3097961 RepID=UPI002F42ABCC
MTLEETSVARLNDAQMRAALAKKPVLLLPIGAVESHGDHLPAGTDNLLAERLAEALAKRLAETTPVLRLPVLPFGQVWSLADAPGSFTLSNETVTATIVEIAMAAKAKGLGAMAVINAHLGNAVAIREAQRRAKEARFTIASFFYPGSGQAIEAVRERPEARAGYMHACEIETSYMLHLAPEAVDMSQAIENYPDFPEDFSSVAYRWSEFSQSPILGDPRAASAEKGRIILDAVLAAMAKEVGRLYMGQDQRS